MSNIGYRRLLILLLAVVVVLLASILRVGWNFNVERLEAKAAWNTLMDYEACRNAVGDMNANEAVGILDHVAHPRSKSRNPHLNMIVDRERARVVQDIIRDLRNKTGEDLGDDPGAWIQKYSAADPQKPM